jgi:hypothetical protein
MTKIGLGGAMLGVSMASLMALASATPASAAVIQCYQVGPNDPACAHTDTNVLMTGTGGPNFVNTNFNGAGAITGTISSDEALVMGASGQADVNSVDGLINTLSYNLLNGLTFTTATFNLLGGTGNVDFTGTVFGITSDGVDFSRQISGNGQNFGGITGDAGERFTGFTLASSGGFATFQQLRLDGVASGVPEPATWALMLMGFGAVGFSMRRGRHAAPRLSAMA